MEAKPRLSRKVEVVWIVGRRSCDVSLQDIDASTRDHATDTVNTAWSGPLHFAGTSGTIFVAMISGGFRPLEVTTPGVDHSPPF